MTDPPDGVDRVLFVCTANQCRSPMAQAAALALAPTPRRPVQFASAGTEALPGLALHPLTAEVLAARGWSLPEFSSQVVTTADLEASSLVVTATRAHRAYCVGLAPRAVRRCFTLHQLSRIAGVILHDEGGRRPPSLSVQGLLAAVPAARGQLQPFEGDEEDVADPVLGGREEFESCADQIVELLGPVLQLIAAS